MLGLNKAGRREWLALSVLTMAVLLLAIDGTVLYMAVPSLVNDMNASATEIVWIGDIYSFALAGLLVTMGNLADRIGRKRLLLIGSVGFGLASALAAFAPTPEMLIAARALLGVAGATIMPSTLSIVRHMFDDPVQRTKAIAIWTAGATGGAALGPLIGGALLTNFWWGSVFLINVPVMVITVIAGIALLPESKNPNAGPIDLTSAAMSVLAVVPLVYAVKRVVADGFHWSLLIVAAAGTVSGLLFIRRQRRLPQPLVDVSLFKLPAFSGAVGANTLAIFALVGILFFFSQYLQIVRGYSPFWAGVAELPVTLTSIVVVVVVGIMMTRLGQGRAIGTGLALAAVGLVGLGLTEGMTSYWGIALSLGVIGFGIGAAMTMAVDAVVAAAPRDRAGAASSISETAYELGVALGVAVLGTAQTALYRTFLEVPDNLDAGKRSALEDSLASGVSQLDSGPHAEVLAMAKHAFTSAMQVTSYLAAALLVVAAVVAWRVIPSAPTKRVANVDSH